MHGIFYHKNITEYHNNDIIISLLYDIILYYNKIRDYRLSDFFITLLDQITYLLS